MTAQKYAGMYRVSPDRFGLAAVAHSFNLEATDRAKTLQTRPEIEGVADMMVAKWKEFCELVCDLELKPNENAMAVLKIKLLSARGFDI